MSKKSINTNIRLNLDNEDDRWAWERLQHLDRKLYKSYTRAIVVALNDFFDRQERMANDPYLETREKEPAIAQTSRNGRKPRANAACETSATAKNHAANTTAFFVHWLTRRARNHVSSDIRHSTTDISQHLNLKSSTAIPSSGSRRLWSQ